MKQENALQFTNWYIANKEGKESNYLSNFFKNDKELFIRKILDFSDEFEANFKFNPLMINYKNLDEIFINNIEEKLKEKNLNFIEYNKKNSNGIPNAIFGKSNYLRFLNEIYILNLEDSQIKNITKLPYRKEFIYFLTEEQGFTIGSANSYASYVTSVNNDVLSKVFKSDFLLKLSDLLDKNNDKEINKHLDLGLTEIIKYNNSKLKSKYKSGFIEYQNFINLELISEFNDFEYDNSEDVQHVNVSENDLIPTKITQEEHECFLKETKHLKETNEVIILDKESILKNFYFRLTTQDRLYGNVFYPISIIKKIFYLDKDNRKYFDEFINNQINKIKILSNGNSINLESISDLIIIPGYTVTANGNNSSLYEVFTQDGYDNSFKLMKVELFKEIAIDHVIPMKELLITHSNKLPKLKSITDLLKKQGISGTGKELLKSVRQTGNFLIETGALGLEDVDELKNELEFLNSLSEFQLMDWKENLKKNKKNK